MKAICWISFAFAVIAGAGLSVVAPDLVQVIVVLAALTVLGIDIAKDRIPNQGAVVVAVALPSLLVSMNGKLADTLSNWLNSLWGSLSGQVGSWAGTTSTIGIAAICVAASFLLARRTMPKSGGGR
jgi:hypothetical protein